MSLSRQSGIRAQGSSSTISKLLSMPMTYARAHEAMAELLGALSGCQIVIVQLMTTPTFQSGSFGRGWGSGMRSNREDQDDQK
jgi:hypothetical protein